MYGCKITVSILTARAGMFIRYLPGQFFNQSRASDPKGYKKLL